MANENKNLSVIKLGDELYNIKDSVARTTCETILGQLPEALSNSEIDGVVEEVLS